MTTQAEVLDIVARIETGRFPCPECGHEGPHDDNNACGDDLSFCCQCGNQVDIEFVERILAGCRKEPRNR